MVIFSACKVRCQASDAAQKIEIVKNQVDRLLEREKLKIASRKVLLNARIEECKKRAASFESKNSTTKYMPEIVVPQIYDKVPPSSSSGDRTSSSKTKVESSIDGTSSRMQKVLDAHGISTNLHQNIVGMSQSNIPKETIIQHVYETYLPDGKTAAEANDIVVAANLALGYGLPRESDTKKANAVKAAQNMEKFQKAKEEFTKMRS